MSFMGSANRIWRMTAVTDQMWARVLLGIVAVLTIAVVWCGVAIGYVVRTIFVVPYKRLSSRRQAAGQIGHHGHVKHSEI